MKRALHVVGEPHDHLPQKPILVTLGDKALSVADTHDGAAAKLFVSCLRDAGADDADGDVDADLLIVIRSAARSSEARERAQQMEQRADVVLGAVRPAFARRLAQRSISQKKP